MKVLFYYSWNCYQKTRKIWLWNVSRRNLDWNCLGKSKCDASGKDSNWGELTHDNKWYANQAMLGQNQWPSVTIAGCCWPAKLRLLPINQNPQSHQFQNISFSLLSFSPSDSFTSFSPLVGEVHVTRFSSTGLIFDLIKAHLIKLLECWTKFE